MQKNKDSNQQQHIDDNSHNKAGALISFQGARVGYGDKTILKDISFDIWEKEMIAIAGPNGGGKSTILKALMGILPLKSGKIEFASGINPHRDISYLPQVSNIDRTFPLSVMDVTASGLFQKYGFFQKVKDTQKVIEVLENVGLGGFVDSPIHNLSGGQFQRMLFARMLLQDAKVILLDEPFSAVDHHTTLDLISILENLNDRGKTIITVIHDYNLIKKYFPKTMLVARSIIGFGETEDVITTSNIEKIQNLSAKWEEINHEEKIQEIL